MEQNECWFWTSLPPPSAAFFVFLQCRVSTVVVGGCSTTYLGMVTREKGCRFLFWLRSGRCCNSSFIFNGENPNESNVYRDGNKKVFNCQLNVFMGSEWVILSAVLDACWVTDSLKAGKLSLSLTVLLLLVCTQLTQFSLEKGTGKKKLIKSH